MNTGAPMGRIPALRPARRGFVLPSAIFLIVILAGLAAFMVHVSGVQQATSAQDVMGSRAWHAAQAGIEWGLYRVLDPANTTAVQPADARWPNMPACPSVNLSVEGFDVRVACTRFPATGSYFEAGGRNAIVVYQLIATATLPGRAVGDALYIERQAETRVSRCRSRDGLPPGYACD